MKPTRKRLHWGVSGFLVISILLAFTSVGFAEIDVSADIDLIYSRMLFNRRTGQTSIDVSLLNTSSGPVYAPLKVVITNISNTAVTVANPDGTEGVNPFFLYDIPAGVLAPGASSPSRRWLFNDPSRARFTFDAIILSSAGASDTDPPYFSITHPADGSNTSDDTPLIRFEFSDADSGINTSSFSATINGVDRSSSFTVAADSAAYQVTAALPVFPLTNTISASISDIAGNSSTLNTTFTVTPSSEPVKFLFSLANNDRIFASAGDGTYRDFAGGDDLGLSSFTDLISVSRVTPNGNLFFSVMDDNGIIQSPADGTNSPYFNKVQLGLAASDLIVANHIDLDGSSFFALNGEPNILQSTGNGFNSVVFDQTVVLGIAQTDQLECLHFDYDGTFYFCYDGAPGIHQSDGGGSNVPFLSPDALGVPGGFIDGFAILPELVPPDITIANPQDGAFLNTTTPSFNVNFQDTQSGIDSSSFFAELNGSDISSLFTVSDTGASYQVPGGSPLAVDDYTFIAWISDNVGNESRASSDFSIGVLRAIPGATPTSGPAPLTVRFTTAGEDPAGTIVWYRWDFDGNGSFERNDTVANDYTRTYNTPGTINVTLQVDSSTGETASAVIPITVQNNPPSATANIVPSNGPVPLTVQLQGTGTDPDGSIVLYEWDFEGDGTFDYSSPSSGTTSHTYTFVGDFQAVFRVTDNDGQMATAVATTTVIRTGPPGSPTAVANASPVSGNAPLTVNLNSNGSFDGDGSIVLYEWDFEDDGTFDFSSATSGSTSHTYTTAGTHVARLRVTDDEGLTGIDQVLVNVNIQTSLSIENDTIGFLSDSGITANASSQYSSSYSPSRAIDGNTSTSWVSAPNDSVGSWFEVSFNVPQRISSFTAMWYSSSYRMSRARIEVYDAAGSVLYTQEADLSGNTSTVTFPTVENASRLRLTAIATAYYYYVYMREFQVDSTPMPGGENEPTGTNVNTTISADTTVSILIKNSDGNVVRNLVNNEARSLGSHSDLWDAKDNSGMVVNDGVYYAVLQYLVDGLVQELDLTDTTGGVRYSVPTGSGCNQRDSITGSFAPYEDDFLPIKFRLCTAQEVTVFVGPLYGGGAAGRVRTILNRMPLPAGPHVAYWDGLDDQGNIAHPPPGDRLILGMWRYSLPDNAMYMTGGRPVISTISSDPNYQTPFNKSCLANGDAVKTTYTLSENANKVELRVISLATNNTVRVVTEFNVPAGENEIFWDGRYDDGKYADAGDYQLALIATDAEGNESMVSYATLVRVYH